MRRFFFLLLLATVLMHTLPGASFLSIEARTIGGTDFDFPSDALASGPALFALAMGTSRENGEVQQQHLLAWQTFLEASESPLKTLPLYHFPIIEAPGFVHGIIRRGIAKSYEGTVAPHRAAVIFTKDTEKFAAAAAIPIDDQATVVLVLRDGTIAGFVKGLPSAESLQTLMLYANK